MLIIFQLLIIKRVENNIVTKPDDSNLQILWLSCHIKHTGRQRAVNME